MEAGAVHVCYHDGRAVRHRVRADVLHQQEANAQQDFARQSIDDGAFGAARRCVLLARTDLPVTQPDGGDAVGVMMSNHE